MKKIVLIIVIGLFEIVNAQTEIPIEQTPSYLPLVDNTYFKDINGVFNKFVGIWVYTEGSKSVEIEIYFEPRNKISTCYFDGLKTKIRYFENGNLVFDTFSNLSKHLYISGGFFPNPTDLNKIDMEYTEPDEPNFFKKRRHERLKLKYFVDSGIEKLEWKLFWQPLQDSAPDPKLPDNMILIKL